MLVVVLGPTDREPVGRDPERGTGQGQEEREQGQPFAPGRSDAPWRDMVT